MGKWVGLAFWTRPGRKCQRSFELAGVLALGLLFISFRLPWPKAKSGWEPPLHAINSNERVQVHCNESVGSLVTWLFAVEQKYDSH